MAASRELLHAAHRRINAALAPCGLHMHEYLALRLLSDSVHEPLRPTSLGMALDATRLEQAVPLLPPAPVPVDRGDGRGGGGGGGGGGAKAAALKSAHRGLNCSVRLPI